MRGPSLLAEVFLELGCLACNSWARPFGHNISLSSYDSRPCALVLAHVFLLGDPGLGEAPPRCVRCFIVQSLEILVRPRLDLLLQCQRPERMGFPKLLTYA